MDKIRKFDFEEKESYSPMEVKAILGDHSKYMEIISGKQIESMTEKIAKLESDNNDFQTKERSRLVKKLAKGVSEEGFEKLIKYANIPEDADEAKITAILEEVNKDFAVVKDTSEPKVVEVVKAKKEVAEKPVKRRFAGRG